MYIYTCIIHVLSIDCNIYTGLGDTNDNNHTTNTTTTTNNNNTINSSSSSTTTTTTSTTTTTTTTSTSSSSTTTTSTTTTSTTTTTTNYSNHNTITKHNITIQSVFIISNRTKSNRASQILKANTLLTYPYCLKFQIARV